MLFGLNLSDLKALFIEILVSFDQLKSISYFCVES